MKGPQWYGYIYPKNIEVMTSPKILVPDIADRASFALDESGRYTFTSGYGIILKESISETYKYILGLLNSKVLDFYLKQVSTTFPIRTINIEDPADVARHDKMVSLVDQMLALNKKLAASKVPQTTEMLKRQIETKDKQIDDLVYKLYDLTDGEIKIVESET